MVDVQTCEVGAKLASVTWDRETLHVDRSSKDDELLTEILRRTRSTNMAGG
jgi:hypothetical protein